MDSVGLYEFLGAAYLRYSFTKGTEQEVDFLVGTLGWTPGTRVLDVGCGPGRHSHALRSRGIDAFGVDLTEGFVRQAVAAASGHDGTRFMRGDARSLPVRPGSFDVAMTLCQGGFGLVGADDGDVLVEMARAVRPGGVVVASAFAAYFAIRFLEDGDRFHAASGVNHERATVRNEAGEERDFDLETSCFTPRELRLLCERAGLTVESIWSVTPGAYAAGEPDLDHPELLVVARR